MALPPDPDLAPVPPMPGSPDDPASRAPAPARPRAHVVPAEPERWTRRHTLAFPLLVDGERLDVIEARALTGREMLDAVMAVEDDVALGRAVRAAMCGLPPEALDALHADDAEALEGVLRPLLPARLREAEDEAERRALERMAAGEG